MSRTLTQFQAEQAAAITTQLDLLEIEPGRYVYRQRIGACAEAPTLSSTMVPPPGALPKTTTTGIIDDAGREALLSGKAPKHQDLIVLGSDLVEALRVRGWVECENDLYTAARQDVWERFESDPALTAADLVRVEAAGHMVFDRHGNALPLAQEFSYIGAGVDESHYDLEALASHLLSRPDIELYSGTVPRGDKRPNLAKNSQDAIFHIPGYNTEEGRTRSLQFRWVPSAADFARIWAACAGKYPSTQIRRQFFELDIVGTKQFAIAPLVCC